jgi:NAD(P)H-hydrate epimerase
MVIGGSKLFHAASLWALEVCSHIVDMVYYASVAENNEIVHQAKNQFRNGIVVPRDKIESYIEEADSILIGPGLPRIEGQETGDDNTRKLTERLLTTYPHKKWVIDGGSLQTIDPSRIPPRAILTPHLKEFSTLFRTSNIEHRTSNKEMNLQNISTIVQSYAKKYNCIIILKGQTDIVASGNKIVTVSGGNAGMTKGGTGDVLAGLTTALYAKNDALLAATAASYINKRAGEKLFETKSYWYNTSDLVHSIPVVLKELIG